MPVLFSCIPEAVIHDVDTVTRFLAGVVGAPKETNGSRDGPDAKLGRGNSACCLGREIGRISEMIRRAHSRWRVRISMRSLAPFGGPAAVVYNWGAGIP